MIKVEGGFPMSYNTYNIYIGFVDTLIALNIIPNNNNYFFVPDIVNAEPGKYFLVGR